MEIAAERAQQTGAMTTTMTEQPPEWEVQAQDAMVVPLPEPTMKVSNYLATQNCLAVMRTPRW